MIQNKHIDVTHSFEPCRALRRSFRLLALGALLGAAGCDGDTEPAATGAPELAAFQLTVTDDVAAEGLATEADSLSAAEVEGTLGLADLDKALGDHAGALRDVREAVRELNEALRAALEPVAAMVRAEAAELGRGDVVSYGVVRGDTEYALTIRRGVGKRFGWVLSARPAGSEEGLVPVAAGRIVVGALERRGTGQLAVDLDALGAADPSVKARGRIRAGFSHGLRGTSLSYTLDDVTPDPSAHAPVSAHLRGVHLEGGYNRVRLAFAGNVPESATDAEELVLARVRHRRGEGGRADLIAVGGDVEDGKALVVSECWDRELGQRYRAVRHCAVDDLEGPTCELVGEVGTETACAYRTSELAPVDPLAPMDDAEDPNEPVDPPADMPDGSAP